MEQIVQFGSDNGLNGILSHKEGNQGPVLLLSNAGVLTRIGPFRLWVSIARSLLKHSVSTFRFDTGGLGDSTRPIAESGNKDYRVEDYRTAMDAIEAKTGQKEFIILGLCSGADNAHKCALLDKRIKAIIMIDGYGYKTKKFLVNYVTQKIFNIRKWKNKFRQIGKKSYSSKDDAGWKVRTFDPPSQVQNEIQYLLDQGCKLYYIYTAGVPEYYNYRNQFWDMFPKIKPNPLLKVSFWDTTNHTFTLVSERQQLISDVVDYVREPLFSFDNIS